MPLGFGVHNNDMMRYRLAIFDFDGTLADSFPWALSVLDHLADRYHLRRVDPADIDRMRRFGARKLLKEYRVPIWKVLRMAGYVRKLMTQNAHHIPLFAGIDALLQGLAGQGLILGLVTSNAYENVCRILGPQNAALIQYYECSVSLFGKPGRLKKILRRSKVAPQDAIYIGDEIRDLEAARKARIPFGAVAWGYTHPEALLAHAPDRLFATVDEIGSTENWLI